MLKPKKAKKPKRASSKVLKKKKRTEKKVQKEEDRVKVKLVLEPEDGEKEKKVDFNLEVEVDPDSPGKEPLTTHLEGQVHLCSDSDWWLTAGCRWRGRRWTWR